jgi:pimeloyl-ACP methyl ester carboxylesterase
VHEAFFFGPKSGQLFGSYHPPASGYGRVLTVICPPLFTDFARTHGALRKVAVSLAEAGQHVLRFDYRGTGDSFGNLEDVTISDWLEDIVMAVREGRDISGCAQVRVLGVRAGALFAAKSLGQASEVERLVLWDPITDGTEYLRELRRVQSEIVGRNIFLRRSERREAMRDYATYRLSDRMLEEFRALDAAAFAGMPENKLFVVWSSVVGKPLGDGNRPDVVGHPCNWYTDDEDLINPDPILERLITRLTTS